MVYNNILKKKSVWIYCTLSLLLVFIILIVAIAVIGPSNLIDVYQEIFYGSRKNWVFLVAGSHGWSNYRHQADVSHAYQILLNNGISADHIIVMMVDDIAYNTQNPFPGELFNKPNGTDVYQGIKIDYSGEDVTKENFLNILQGNKESMKTVGSHRVIESDRSDNIFVNFVGHGTSGMLSFPSGHLYADELNNAFLSMYSNRTFNNMLLYIEACNSGSLFDGILSEFNNIFALTAASPRESSYGVYLIEFTATKTLTFLGDEFSVSWMEDQANFGLLYPSQVKEIVKKRTVLNHFNTIRALVKQSNVMPYGDFSVGQDKLSSYIGKPPEVFSKPSNSSQYSYSSKNKIRVFSDSIISAKSDKIYQMSEEKNSEQWKQRVEHNNIMRKIMDRVFNGILQGVVRKFPNFNNINLTELREYPSRLPLDVFPCYRQTLDQITKNCFSLPKNTYSLKLVHIFFNLCARAINSKTWKSEEFDFVIQNTVLDVCIGNLSTFPNLKKIIDTY
ncbi:Peptidase C13, legumain [Cinara cedri]|uniref:legumain n=1 Tax=Cinara cedri TaxID=506608 RepID=A0A5E4NLV0_9HEMI|nr:Peptidase C13, legumain [Cinara cedri]